MAKSISVAVGDNATIFSGCLARVAPPTVTGKAAPLLGVGAGCWAGFPAHAPRARAAAARAAGKNAGGRPTSRHVKGALAARGGARLLGGISGARPEAQGRGGERRGKERGGSSHYR